MPLQHIGLIGATGRLGPALLAALEAASPAFTLTVFRRPESQGALPSTRATVVTLPSPPTVASLTPVFSGLDALVVALPGGAADLHITLADACAAAGVRRFIPPDFGSVDAADPEMQKLVPLYAAKTRVRAHCEALSAQHPDFTWTSLVCGHFFDWGLREGFLGFDLPAGEAKVFDDGERKWSASTLDRVGVALVRVLQRDAATRNRAVHVQSFCVSQGDVLEVLMANDPRQLSVSFVKSAEQIPKLKERSDKGDKQATEELVSVLGMVYTNWEEAGNLANALLGLENEDLAAVMSAVARDMAAEPGLKMTAPWTR